jgi:HNH endonuclease
MPKEQFMKQVSVSTLIPYLPDNVHLREDGTVVSIDDAGTVHPMPIEYNSNGKPYVRFVHDEAGTDFHLWLTREFYRAFRGVMPDGYEAFHVDGNRANLKPSNLEIRPKSRTKSRFSAAHAPKGGSLPSAA